MINHLRTLLLNQAGSIDTGPSYPGDEYIPPAYQGIILTQQLAMLQSSLFGPNADRAMRNFRVREVLAILHSTELASYVTGLDPRVTYWPPHSDKLFRSLAFGVNAIQMSGNAVMVSVQGSLSQFTTLGTIYQQWTVTVLNSNTVQVVRSTAPTSTVNVSYAITGGLSNPIPLTGSNLSLIFSTPGAGLPAWQVNGLAYPLHTLNNALADLGSNGIAQLFGPEQPYTTFSQIWNTATLPSFYRLGVAVLTLGYRMNEIFTSNPQP